MADNVPQQDFAPISPIEPSGGNQNAASPEFLHFDEVSLLLATAENYIEETRSDLEHASAPEQWIEDLMQSVLSAKQQLQLLEIDAAEDPILWTDEDGIDHEVMMRDQNKKGFDAFVTNFTKVQVGFDSYFKRHVAHLKAVAEVAEQ